MYIHVNIREMFPEVYFRPENSVIRSFYISSLQLTDNNCSHRIELPNYETNSIYRDHSIYHQHTHLM